MVVILGFHRDERGIADCRIAGRPHFKPGQPARDRVAAVVHVPKPEIGGKIGRIRTRTTGGRQRPNEVVLELCHQRRARHPQPVGDDIVSERVVRPGIDARRAVGIARRINRTVADLRGGTLAWGEPIGQVIGISREDGVFVGQTMIDSDVRRLVRLPTRAVIRKIVRQAGLIRHRVERHQLRRRRIEADGRNDVPGKWCPGAAERIVNGRAQLGKIAAAHPGGWHRDDERLVFRDATLVVIHEEERPVRLQRSAQAAAKLIEMIQRLGNRKEVLRVEMLIPAEVETRSAKLVTSGLRDDVDHPAERPAVLSRIEIGLDDDFLNRVDRWLDAHAAHDAFGVVQPVDQLQVVVFGVAVNRHRRGLPAVIGAIAADRGVRRALARAGRQLHDVDDVAPGDWRVLDRFRRQSR